MIADSVTRTANVSTIDRSGFLRRSLQADILVSGAIGLLFLFGSDAVARFLGLPDAANIIRAMSLIGFGWAELNLWISTRPSIKRWQVFTVIEDNVLWAVAGVVLLLGGWLPLNTAGMWAVAVSADIVAVLAILQYIGRRRMNA